MEELLNELDRVADSGFAYVSLYTALTVPDMCGALTAPDGRASGKLYKEWFDAWVAPKYTVGPDRRPSLSGETCYAYRCGLLHQGRSIHSRLGYSRILFIEPRQGLTFHNNVLNDALNIDIPSFVHDMTSSARAWLESVRGTEPFERNFSSVMRRHVGGLAPYIGGVDVIS